MELKPAADRMKERWLELYPDQGTGQLEEFINELNQEKQGLEFTPHESA